MFPIDMEDDEELSVAPSVWQALETAWLGVSPAVAMAHLHPGSSAGAPGRSSAMQVRRIRGVASLSAPGGDA